MNYLKSIYHLHDLREENNKSIKIHYFLNAVKEEEEKSILELQACEEGDISIEKEYISNDKTESDSLFKLNICPNPDNNGSNLNVDEDAKSKKQISFTNTNPIIFNKKAIDFSLTKICIPQRKSTQIQDELHVTLDGLRNAFIKDINNNKSLFSKK